MSQSHGSKDHIMLDVYNPDYNHQYNIMVHTWVRSLLEKEGIQFTPITAMRNGSPYEAFLVSEENLTYCLMLARIYNPLQGVLLLTTHWHGLKKVHRILEQSTTFLGYLHQVSKGYAYERNEYLSRNDLGMFWAIRATDDTSIQNRV